MASNDGLQVVVFRAGDSEYCADIRDVREIIRLDSVTNIPGSGDHVEGVINVRGEIIPLISLRSLTGIPHKGTDKETRVLIVDDRPAFGLIVDTVGEVKNVPRDAVVALPAMIRDRIDSNLFTGVAKLPDRILIIVDLKKVVARDHAPEAQPKTAGQPAPIQTKAEEVKQPKASPETPAPTPAPAPGPVVQPHVNEAATVSVPDEGGEVAAIAATLPAGESQPTIEVLVRDQRMTNVHLDALREIGNIGTSHAATSLSTLVGSPININVPNLKLIPINNISGVMNEAMMVGLLLELKNGDETAGFLYNLFPISSALRIVDKLMGMEIGSTRDLDEMGQSAIMEVGNIISSSFCDAVAEFLGISILPTPPSFVCDMADSILQNTLVEISMMADDAIIFRTDMADDEHIFEGYVLLFPNPATLDMILSIIDSKLGV